MRKLDNTQIEESMINQDMSVSISANILQMMQHGAQNKNSSKSKKKGEVFQC